MVWLAVVSAWSDARKAGMSVRVCVQCDPSTLTCTLRSQAAIRRRSSIAGQYLHEKRDGNDNDDNDDTLPTQPYKELAFIIQREYECMLIHIKNNLYNLIC